MSQRFRRPTKVYIIYSVHYATGENCLRRHKRGVFLCGAMTTTQPREKVRLLGKPQKKRALPSNNGGWPEKIS